MLIELEVLLLVVVAASLLGSKLDMHGDDDNRFFVCPLCRMPVSLGVVGERGNVEWLCWLGHSPWGSQRPVLLPLLHCVRAIRRET
jgi:hypothetical protein